MLKPITATLALSVVFRDGWKIIANELESGPYASKEDAIVTARAWAENASKQGRRVRLLLRDEGAHRPHGELSRKARGDWSYSHEKPQREARAR